MLGSAEQEGGSTVTGASDLGASCYSRRECKIPVPLPVTGQTPVLRPSDIGAPLKGMVTRDFGPVIHELENILPLIQRAIALVNGQAVPHTEPPLPFTSIEGNPEVSGLSGRFTFGIPASCAVFLP